MASPDDATYAASHLIAKLAALSDVTDEGQRDRIMKRLSDETRRQIRDMFRGQWLPLAVDVELSAALFDELGEKGARAVSRQSVLRSMEGPVLGPLTRGTLALFGVSPRHFFSVTPRGWTRIYRRAGRLTVRHVPSGSDLFFRGLPAGFFERGYLDGVAGGLRGCCGSGGSRAR